MPRETEVAEQRAERFTAGAAASPGDAVQPQAQKSSKTRRAERGQPATPNDPRHRPIRGDQGPERVHLETAPETAPKTAAC